MSGDFIKCAKILSVDDDEAARKLMIAYLAPIGCEVRTASNGTEALEFIGRESWDLILMDLLMPGLTGFDVLERIRHDYPMAKLPVILVTGKDDDEAHSRGLQLRANDFIAKPVEQAELLARVGTILTMRWAQVELEDKLNELNDLRKNQDRAVCSVVQDLCNSLTHAQASIALVVERISMAADQHTAQLRKALSEIDQSIAIATDAMNVSRQEEEVA